MDTCITPREIQIVTDAITHSLRYPSRQTFCLRAITAIIPMIYLEMGNRRMDKVLRAEDHDFLDTITSFVTTQRSEEGSRVLTEQLFRCNCNRTISSIESLHHRSWCGSEADGLFLALESLIFRILAGILSKLSQDKLYKLSSGTQNSRWPTKVSDLMPNGESVTVDAFVAHGMKGRSTYSLTILAFYYLYIPSTLECAIGRGNCYNAVSYNLDIAVEYFERTSAEDFSGPAFDDNVIRIRSIHNYVHSIDKVFSAGQLRKEFLDQMERVMESNARTSYEIVVRLLDVFSSSSLHLLEPECFDSAKALAVIFWLYIPASTIRASRLVLHPLVSDTDRFAQKFLRNGPDPYLFIYWVIEYYLERKDCSNPDCLANQRDENRAFSYCSGCRCMKYCSKECQKTCWTISYVPHKKICKVLCPLRQMFVDAGKKASKANKTDEVDEFLTIKVFTDKVKAGGVSHEEVKGIYEEMRKLMEKDNRKRLGSLATAC